MDFFINSLYRYAGEVLTKPTTIFVTDHHYDEENDVWPLQQLLDASTCKPEEHTLLFDMIIHDDRFAQYNPICEPWTMEWLQNEFEEENIVPDWTNKTVPFNFMINKERPHRIHLLRMIENAKLTNFTYSLPWLHNQYTNVKPTNYMIGTEIQLENSIIFGSIRNSTTYKQLLQKNVFEPSCISLITEPTYIEKEAQLSEKTIMAIYGGTVPIYVGGWRSADALRILGFDVFDDIVDHSYETLEDPWDRITKAFELNIDLLESFTVTDTILKRMQYNLDLLTDGVFRKALEHIKGPAPLAIGKL